MRRNSPVLVALSALALSTCALASAPAAPASVAGPGHITTAVTGGWSSPRALSRSGVPARYLDLAVAHNGTATVVWNEHHASGNRIAVSWRVLGGAWRGPRVLSGPVGRRAMPQVAMNRRSAVVAWLSPNGRVVVSRDRARSGWTQPAAVTGGKRHRRDLQVALDRRGDITLVWREAAYVVRSVRRLAGGRWSRPARLSGVRGYDFAPQVTMDDAGRATVVWLRDFDNSDDCPVMITHRARGAAHWSKAVPLAVTQGCGDPELVTNSRGDSAAQWTGSPFEGVRPYPVVGVHPERRPWRTHRLRPRSWDGDASIAIGDRGTVAAAWAEKNSSTVWTARRPGPGPWKPAVALSSAGQPWLVISTQIALGRNGTTTVVWLRALGNGVYDLQVAQRGGTWGAVESVSQGLRVSRSGGFRVATDQQDHTVVAWTHYENGAPRIMVTTR